MAEVAAGEVDGLHVVGHHVVHDAAGVDGHRRAAELLLGDVLPGRPNAPAAGPAAKIDADSVMATKSHSGAVRAP